MREITRWWWGVKQTQWAMDLNACGANRCTMPLFIYMQIGNQTEALDRSFTRVARDYRACPLSPWHFVRSVVVCYHCYMHINSIQDHGTAPSPVEGSQCDPSDILPQLSALLRGIQGRGSPRVRIR
ncbi:hypothetical protein IG631_18337 [Alternaria alternata]|nr:hypothetical protein IG631_18337 [Alternaria alternata]